MKFTASSVAYGKKFLIPTLLRGNAYHMGLSRWNMGIRLELIRKSVNQKMKGTYFSHRFLIGKACLDLALNAVKKHPNEPGIMYSLGPCILQKRVVW